MELQANAVKMATDESGTVDVVFTVTAPPYQVRGWLAQQKEILAKGKTLDVKVKQHRDKRSLDANAYMWVLCGKIAEVLRNKTSAEDVYKRNVRDCGQYKIFPMQDKDVEDFIGIWSAQGIGWFAESLGESKIQGCQNIRAFYGSSLYNTQQMSVLLDGIITECKELGIETLPPEKLAIMKGEWGA